MPRGHKWDSESAKKARAKSSGRKVPQDIKAIRALEKYEAEKMWFELSRMPVSEVRELAESDNTPMYLSGMASYYLTWKKNGDPNATNLYLNRTLGPVPQKVEQDIRDLTREEELDRLAKHLREIAKKPE